MKQFFGALFLLVVIISCKTNDDPDNTPLNGETLTIEERLAALDACRDKFSELEEMQVPDAEKRLVAWLKSQPYIAGAGIASQERNVWAHFKDGRFIMFVNNLQRVPEGMQGGRLAFDEPLAKANGTSNSAKRTSGNYTGARTAELPTNKKVAILNGMGTAFIDPTNAIRQIFAASKTNYQLESAEASIENLKKIGKEHAIFYLNTHGGGDSLKVVNGKALNPVLGFWTTDSCSAENEAKYKDDLDNYRLGYMVALNDQISPGKATKETHYAISAEFVRKYMEFGENSLIYITACNGFRESPSGVDFREAVMEKADKNKAAYLGWTHPIYESDGYVTTKFVFDRLLGANTTNTGTNFPIPVEDPYQRPFDIAAIMKDMSDRGLDVSNVIEDGKLQKSYMKCYNKITEDDRFILAPSIAYVAIDEMQNKLHLYGIFGSDPKTQGEVTVDGIKLTIDSWNKNEIVCPISATGKGSAGDVIVSVRNNQSNAVQITEWEWKVELTRAFQGTLKETMTASLRLRADVHAYRRRPHGDPSPYVLFLPLPGMDSVTMMRPTTESKGLYTAGGTGTSKWTSGSCSYTDKEDWAGVSANLPLVDGPISTPQNHMAPSCFLNPKTKTMEFSFEWLAKGHNWNYQINQVCPGQSIPPIKDQGEWFGQGMFVSPYFANLEELTEDELVNFRIETIQFDSNWNIKPYQKIFTTDDTNYGFINLNDTRCTITIKWALATAKFPPRSNAGARIANQ